ncbi:hypothetical protein C8F04DRAFT_1264062 [Mycena alexandri]|uniref:Uncharacterized protein n=1 Tax=Mycena alexandri TaxID=1745969 RepID=A0AAD6SMI5_9AGAR|nr:hypothetical protein C8F04DRAFT_1264062 [Mycena alexandri]
MATWWEKIPWYEGLDAAGNPMPAATIDLSKLLPLAALQADGGEEPAASGSALTVGGAVFDGAKDGTVLNASVLGANVSVEEEVEDDVDSGWKKTGGVNPVLKGAIQAHVKEQVKHWFSYRKTVANRSNNNPYQEWLSGFRRPVTRPKKLLLHKFYMQQEGYTDNVEALFQERWPKAGLESKKALAFRCTLAEELLRREPQEVLEELVEQQNAEHEEALEDQADKIANPDAPSDEDRHHCRTNLAQVVQPFIDGIAKLTGFHVTVLAGAPPPPGGGTKFALTTMHSGRTHVDGPGEGLKFDEWDIEGFKKGVLGQFMKYLLETAPHCKTDTNVPGARGPGSSPGGGGPGVKARGEENVAEGNERGRAKGKGKGKARVESASPTPSPSASRTSSRSGSPDAERGM